MNFVEIVGCLTISFFIGGGAFLICAFKDWI